jgi:hypothetical protein
VRGARRLPVLEQAEALRRLRVILTAHRPNVELKIKGTLGEAALTPRIYDPILDLLADHQPRTLGSLEQELARHDVSFGLLLQAVMVLVGGGNLAVAQEEAMVARSKPQSERINACVLHKARSMLEIGYVASPVTGGGVSLSRIAMLFLLARQQGRQTPREWAQFAWELMKVQGHRVSKSGQVLESDEDNLAELEMQAVNLAEHTLPLLKGLQII